MKIEIKKLGIDRFELIFDTVQLLLDELRGKPSDNAESHKDKIIADWRKLPGRHTVYAAYDGEQIAGIITLTEHFAIYADGTFGNINELYVFPKYRSRGVGKMLLEKAVELGKEKGWHRIEVTAPHGEQWSRTVAFYLREGFSQAGPKLRLFA